VALPRHQRIVLTSEDDFIGKVPAGSFFLYLHT
jgi:hypothetical protein